MVRVKICGITNRDDALQAVDAGADALGFVFYERSPRNVAPEVVADIVSQLPPMVATVGLFVNASDALIRQRCRDCGLDVAQLHGSQSPSAEDLAPLRVLPAVSVKDATSLDALTPDRTWLLDAFVEGEYGGTGKTFNWDLAIEAAKKTRIVLAGGLTPDNVAEAVQRVRPYGVDVSSGVEAAPGKKDRQKVAAFIRAAKEI